MKGINNKIKILIALFFFLMLSCQKDFLEEEVYTEYDPDDYLQTIEGINSVLISAYSPFLIHFKDIGVYQNEYVGDIMWQFGGGAEATATLYMNFKLDPLTRGIEWRWDELYQSIRNANSFLDNIHKAKTLSDEKAKKFKAEARFIRAADYYYLWEHYGPVPLITTTLELNLEPLRATDEEFDSFLITELQAAVNDLPVTQDLYGKVTKGAALALLAKYYLNSKQWQKAADATKQVIDLNKYQLFDGELANMFAVENEENEEMILVAQAIPSSGSAFMVYAFPPKYPVQSNWSNYGNQMCIRNEWFKTYHPDDKRREWFLTSYTDTDGNFQDLLDPTSIGRSVRCFKYVPDPNANGRSHGNDMSIIRYADVLLSRAEALNELNGPNQESVDLLNQIRERAGVPVYNLSDFSSKEAFRDAILEERGWEFVAEGLRRADLVRHGKLISRAKERDASDVQDYMTIFPIPQKEKETNPNLEQNQGY